MAGWTSAALWVVLSAGPSPIDLSWDAPKECPSHAATMASVVERLPPRADAAPFRVEGRIVSKEGRYRLVLHVSGETWTIERSLEDPDCHALSDAAALISALAISSHEPRAEGSTQAPEAEVPPQPPEVEAHTREPGGSLDAQEEPPLSPKQGRSADSSGGLRVGGGLSLDAQRRAQLMGLLLQVAPWVQRRHVRAEIGFDWQPARPFRAADGQGVNVWRWGLSPRFCGVPTWGAWAVGLCAGAEVGQMGGRGVGQPRNLSTRVWWGSVLGSGSLELALLPNFGLVSLAAAKVALVRPKFNNFQEETVYQASRVNLSVLFGVFFRWPKRIGPALSNR